MTEPSDVIRIGADTDSGIVETVCETKINQDIVYSHESKYPTQI